MFRFSLIGIGILEPFILDWIFGVHLRNPEYVSTISLDGDIHEILGGLSRRILRDFQVRKKGKEWKGTRERNGKDRLVDRLWCD